MKTPDFSKKTALRGALHRTLAALLLSGLIFSLTLSQAPQNPISATSSAGPKVLNKDEIMELLKLETPDSILIPRIHEAGIGFTVGQADIDDLIKVGASDALLKAIGDASSQKALRLIAEGVEERVKLMAAPYKAKGVLVTAIISIREGPEDAMLGRGDNGYYFKATLQGWTQLDPGEVNGLAQDIKDDLSRKTEHPIIWLVNREHLEDKDFNQNFKKLIINVLTALFGPKSNSIYITLYDPRVPTSVYQDGNYFSASKLIFCCLSKDHCVTSPKLSSARVP